MTQMTKHPVITAKEFRAGMNRLGVPSAHHFAEVFGISSSSAARYARDGVPKRSADFIAACLNDKARVREHGGLPMSTKEFRVALKKSGMTAVGLSGALSISESAIKKWKNSGVPRGNADRVRDVLSRPQDFPEATVRKRSRPHRVSAEQFRALMAPMTVTQTALRLGGDVTEPMVRSWRAKGVPRWHEDLVESVLGSAADVEPLNTERLSAKSLRVLMTKHEVSVRVLAGRAGVKVATVDRWLRVGVHERNAEQVAALVRGETTQKIQVPPREVNPLQSRGAERVPGEGVRDMVAAAGLTQTQAGALVGVTQTTMSKWMADGAPLVWMERMAECENETLAAGARRLLAERAIDPVCRAQTSSMR